jgi:hypothetical protein
MSSETAAHDPSAPDYGGTSPASLSFAREENEKRRSWGVDTYTNRYPTPGSVRT